MHRILESISRARRPLARDSGPAQAARPLDCHSDRPFPRESQDLRLLNAFRSQAHFRLIFEEFFWLEMRNRAETRRRPALRPGIAFELNDRVREQIKAMLPFKPTGAQKRVLAEIAQDMSEPHPMNRLLQGDVGSGKTLVAAEAAIIAIENGYQVAVLAPTEILATQHYLYFKNLFASSAMSSLLLTGSNTAREKAQLKQLVAEGFVHVVDRNARAARSGRRVPEARPGDRRRAAPVRRDAAARSCSRKGEQPDVLVMTATPIPRTLALTMYGDLDTSVIDELPPGRKPIMTKHVPEDRVEQVYSFVQAAVDAGPPGVRCLSGDRGVGDAGDEGRPGDARASVASRVSRISRVGLLHGKLLAGRQRSSGWRRFKRGETQDPGLDHRDRSRRGCSERHRDGDRAGRTFRPGAAASASRPGGTRRRAELLHSGHRKAE